MALRVDAVSMRGWRRSSGRPSRAAPHVVLPARPEPLRLTGQLAEIRVQRRIATTLAALTVLFAGLYLGLLGWGLASRLRDIPYVADGSAHGCAPRIVEGPSASSPAERNRP